MFLNFLDVLIEEELKPEDFVVPDQFVDRATQGRLRDSRLAVAGTGRAYRCACQYGYDPAPQAAGRRSAPPAATCGKGSGQVAYSAGQRIKRSVSVYANIALVTVTCRSRVR